MTVTSSLGGEVPIADDIQHEIKLSRRNGPDWLYVPLTCKGSAIHRCYIMLARGDFRQGFPDSRYSLRTITIPYEDRVFSVERCK